MPAYVKVSGSWVPLGAGDEVYWKQSGSWTNVEHCYVKVSGSWQYVDSFVAPGAISGAGISRDGGIFGPEDHVASWSTTSAEPNTNYSVEVWWYLNGALDHTSSPVAQSVGSVTRTYNAEDDVYCRIRYVNGFGDGPWSTTSTI